MDLVGKWFSFGKNENYDKAIRHYEAGEFAEAAEQFKVCLASDPDPSTRERSHSYLAGALGKLARSAYSDGDLRASLDHLDEAISHRPGFADLRMLRCQVFDALGRHEERAFEIQFSLDLNPRYGFALLHDGIQKLEAGDTAAAQIRFQEAIGADARIDTDEFRDALALLDSGDVSAAVEGLKRVVPRGKTDVESIIRNADRLAQDARWSDAEEAYRRALDLAPNYADLRCKRGQVLMQMDEVEQAIAEFREALTINPRYADAYAMLGVAFRRSGLREEAQSAFRAALQFDPNHVVASSEIERL